MVCEKVIGKLKDVDIAGKTVEYVDIVNWEDRGTCILFGDGAGAAVVSADEDGNIDGRGIS